MIRSESLNDHNRALGLIAILSVGVSMFLFGLSWGYNQGYDAALRWMSSRITQERSRR